MMIREDILGLLLSSAVSALAAPAAAQAQEAAAQVQDEAAKDDSAPQQQDTRAAGGPGDIIVTARKRQESILKVPVVETVLSGAQIDTHAITTLGSLSTRVPGLSFGAAVLAIGPQISLRGVGTSTLDAGVDQSVSLNLDGLSLTQGLAYAAGLFDLAQVEVLKGPQALFFGKNSPGGVISIRTADPGDRLEVIGRLSREFEARQNRGELIVSVPVTDTLGVRFSGYDYFQDGYFHNRAVAPTAFAFGARTPKKNRVDDANSNLVRLTALWKPSPSFDARLKVNIIHDSVDGNASENQLTSCPDGTGPVPGTGLNFFAPNEDCKLDRTLNFVDLDPAAFPGVPHNGTPYIDTVQKFGTLELNLRPMDRVTLTSITGYYHLRSNSMINGTMAANVGPALYAANNFGRRDVTEELRVDTDFASAVNFTGGGYYQDGLVTNRITVGGNTTLGLPASLAEGTHRVDITVYSAFGQLRVRPFQKIELAGGVRWTEEKRSDATYLFNTRMLEPDLKANNLSPEFTITYTPTDNLTAFASYKKGYKSGSYTVTTPVQPEQASCIVGVSATCIGQDNSFGDERVSGFEGGLKARLFDHQLSANLAGYRYVYKGLQVGANEPAQNGLPIVRTINAGSALVYGVDFDLAYQPISIPGLTLNGAVNWNHARFTQLDNVPCYGGQTIAAGCNSFLDPTTGRYVSQNLTGTRLVRAPDWQLTGGFAYERPVGKYVGNFTLDGTYSTRFPTALGRREDFYQNAYGTLNASASVRNGRGTWELALIGNNLTDKITCGSSTPLNYANGNVLGGELTGGNDVGPAGVDEVTCVARQGRELFLRLTLRPTGR